MSNNEVSERKNDVAILGENEVFIRRTANGHIKAVKGKINLSEAKGHLTEIQGKVMVNEAGYREMNKIAGVSIITPQNLTLPDGNTVVNPYPVIDPDSGTISKVWAKKMGIGYSPTGNLVITSSTLLYDIKMYLIQDLAKKVQYNKDAGKLCMKQTLTEDELKKGAFYQIEGEMGVWVDLSHKEVIKAHDTYINNKLYAERKAQTICERNVMKKHPALSANVEAKGNKDNHYAQVTVIGFTSDLSKDELLQIADQAEKDEDVQVRGEKAEVIDTIDEITEEDVAASQDEEEMARNSEPESDDQPQQNIFDSNEVRF